MNEKGFNLDDLADACVDAEIPDGKYESLCISLKNRRTVRASSLYSECREMTSQFHNFSEDVLFNELLDELCCHKTELRVLGGLSEDLQKNFDRAESRLFAYLEDEFIKRP